MPNDREESRALSSIEFSLLQYEIYYHRDREKY